MAWTVPWNLMGIAVAGDVAGLTVYTDRFMKKVAYPFAPPKEPPSPLQVAQREKFRVAQLAWRNLTPEQKQSLELACHKTAIPLTGQNLYMSAQLRNDPDSYKTIEHQSGIPLPPLPS